MTFRSESYAKGEQCNYLTRLQLTEQGADKYQIIRKDLETGQEIELVTLTKAQLQRNQYQYYDAYNLKKHGQYQYRVLLGNQEISSNLVRVANISPQFSEKLSFYPKITGTKLQFNLGKLKDAEGDALEYHLYTRYLGDPVERLVSAWRIDSKADQVQTVTFPDMTICEWKLVCVEIDERIKDRQEVTVIDWTYLKLDLNHKLD